MDQLLTARRVPLPLECQTATNLTQSWRMEHNGGGIRGGGPNAYFNTSGSNQGYACDLRRSLGWFRFAGPAGTCIYK